jgi:hypothetical protein
MTALARQKESHITEYGRFDRTLALLAYDFSARFLFPTIPMQTSSRANRFGRRNGSRTRNCRPRPLQLRIEILCAGNRANSARALFRDERYELVLDGERVAMGSERGDANNWFYETFDFELQAGEHTLVALVFSVGAERPHAQMTVRHGWLFRPQTPEHIALLGTGVADWHAKIIDG